MKKIYIDKNKRRVVVNLHDKETVQDELKRLDENLFDLINSIKFPNKNKDEEKVFTGIAKCQDSDYFDENVGLDIAECKAYYKYHKSMVNEYNEKIIYLNKTIRHLEELRNLHIRKHINIDNYLKRYKNN